MSTTFRLVVITIVIRHTRLSTVGDRAFPIAAAISGTVYRSTSHPCSQCQSCAVTLRHVSSGAASRNYVVVPEKWNRHFRTH